MTAIEIYAFFGPPVIAVALGFAALWLVDRDYRRLDVSKNVAKQQGR